MSLTLLPAGSAWQESKACRVWWGRLWMMSCRPTSGTLSTWTRSSLLCFSTCRVESVQRGEHLQGKCNNNLSQWVWNHFISFYLFLYIRYFISLYIYWHFILCCTFLEDHVTYKAAPWLQFKASQAVSTRGWESSRPKTCQCWPAMPRPLSPEPLCCSWPLCLTLGHNCPGNPVSHVIHHHCHHWVNPLTALLHLWASVCKTCSIQGQIQQEMLWGVEGESGESMNRNSAMGGEQTS